MSSIEIVPIKPYSDGDASQKPNAEWKIVNPPTIYLDKIATLWIQKRGEVRPNKRYYLDKLPAGYSLFERGRKDLKSTDKHLYGHPNGKYFDSPNRFFPHFDHLMTNGTSRGCPCTVCGAKGGVPLPIGRSASRKPQQLLRPIPQHAKANRAVDEEDTPDTIRHFIDRLKIAGQLDEPIEERLSMDWRAERHSLPDALSKLSKQRSWLPRVGELVLFIRDNDGEICLDDVSQEYRLVRGHKATNPPWEAGVVGQVPEENVKLEDIVIETTKIQGLAYSGYRLEPLPDPNGTDKSLSRRYKYVPLHHIRPFVFWQEFLRGSQKQKWHPTINNALKVMGSMSLLERFRFKGTWPSATVFCRGIYIGSELICVGDTVRIIPAKDTVRDVLQVESIRLFLSNLDKAGDDDEDEGHPYNITVHLCGKAYTLDENRGWSLTPVSRAHVGMEGYDDWFSLHDPSKTYRLAFSSVLGRCFEANPMLLWFPTDSAENGSANGNDGGALSLTRGLGGIREARLYSAEHDERILSGKSWFWGDSRAETLDIKTLNNVEISYHDRERDEDKLEEWQKAAKVLDKTASVAEQASLVHKLHLHRLASMNTSAADASTGGGGGGGGGALRAAAAVSLGSSTPADDDDDESVAVDSQGGEMLSEDVSRLLSKSTSKAPTTVTVAIPVSTTRGASTAQKRSFSTMVGSRRDELDHIEEEDEGQGRDGRTRSSSSVTGNGASYNLEDWVKPVVMSRTTVSPSNNKSSPLASQVYTPSPTTITTAPLKSFSQHLAGPPRHPGTAKRTKPTHNTVVTSTPASTSTSTSPSTSKTIRKSSSASAPAPVSKQPRVTTAAPLYRSNTIETISSSSSSSSEDMAAGGAATDLLAAFQKGVGTSGGQKGTTTSGGQKGTATLSGQTETGVARVVTDHRARGTGTGRVPAFVVTLDDD